MFHLSPHANCLFVSPHLQFSSLFCRSLCLFVLLFIQASCPSPYSTLFRCIFHFLFARRVSRRVCRSSEASDLSIVLHLLILSCFQSSWKTWRALRRDWRFASALWIAARDWLRVTSCLTTSPCTVRDRCLRSGGATCTPFTWAPRFVNDYDDDFSHQTL